MEFLLKVRNFWYLVTVTFLVLVLVFVLILLGSGFLVLGYCLASGFSSAFLLKYAIFSSHSLLVIYKVTDCDSGRLIITSLVQDFLKIYIVLRKFQNNYM